MSLGGDIAATLPLLREQAQSMMTSTCVITRGGGSSELDEDSGEYQTASETVYTGVCRIKFGGSQANTVDAQAQLLTEQIATLSLPINSSAGIEVDDIATITSNRFDPDLVGKRFRVDGIHFQTAATARRLSVEIIS